MFAVGSVVKGDILFRLQGDGTLFAVQGTAGDRNVTFTPDHCHAVARAEGAAGADFALGLLDAMAFGFALAFVFAVPVLRAGTRVFNGHVLRADANTPLFAVNLHTFGQQAVARHRGDARRRRACLMSAALPGGRC